MMTYTPVPLADLVPGILVALSSGSPVRYRVRALLLDVTGRVTVSFQCIGAGGRNITWGKADAERTVYIVS